jgi:hypothetical protein
MFRGTYQIINVTHHIEQGDMVTKFKGVRMANVTTRLVEQSGVRRKSDQTDAGTNAQRNGSMLASPDNDCEYPKFPIGKNGDFDVNLSNDEIYNASQIMAKIIARGYTKEQAAGIVGNMAVESPGFVANIAVCDCNKSGTICSYSGGICMWHGSGFNALKNLDPAHVNDGKYAAIPCSKRGQRSKELGDSLPPINDQITFLLDSYLFTRPSLNHIL